MGMLALMANAGCHDHMVDRTDRRVYGLIADRQRHSLGTEYDVRVEDGPTDPGGTDGMYSFTPRPADPTVPEAFQVTPAEAPDDADMPDAPEEAAAPADADSQTGPEMSPDIYSTEERAEVQTFGLRDSLAYAMRHGRSLQNAKEDLYLAGLELSLERHLWTPQLAASFQAAYDDFEDTDPNFDRAMTTVSEAAVSQQLPYGGSISAKIIHTLMRDIGDHVEKGETGQMILEAAIPLLRGAGRAAYESRYAAERELIYAVRRYERFRRSFLVDVAAEYFNLQQAKAAIANTYTSYLSRRQAWEKAEAFQRLGKSRSVFEAPRAKSNLRRAESALVSAKERFESALDRFKILIGMPVESRLDVVGQDEDRESRTLDALLPDVDEPDAVEIAVKFRLDLLNEADRVDDARRGIAVARNRILPDLELTGSTTLNSDPGQLRPLNVRRERTTWRGGVTLRVDDRETERSAYRSSLVALRRAERDYDVAADTVQADVRRALRRIHETSDLRLIQRLNVEENEGRLQAAQAQFDLGRSTNQDLVDAEDDLLAARNDYASAVAAYRVAILALRRDTGTLRVTDEGRWDENIARHGARDTAAGP
jgi:outer membrane protein TolC